jgi:hypothetical protein
VRGWMSVYPSFVCVCVYVKVCVCVCVREAEEAML